MRELTSLAALIDPRKDSSKTALIDRTGGPARTVSFGAFENAAAVRRDQLRARFGLAKGDTCCLFADNSLQFLETYMGVLMNGAVAVLLNPRAPEEQIAHILADAAPKLIVANRRVDAPQRRPHARYDDLAEAQVAPAGEPDRVGRDDLAIVLYTSGSTGTPKGVELTHGSQTASIEALGPLADMMMEQRAIIAAPLFHMNALNFVHMMLAAHGSFVLLDRFEPVAFHAAVRSEGVTLVSGVPTMIARLAAAARENGLEAIEHVAFVTLGSAPLTMAVREEARALFPNAVILNGYGTTEIGPGVFGAHPEGLERPALSVGHPTPNHRVRLVGSNRDDEGVLEVSGPGLLRGYRNLPEKTSEKLKGGWFNTGDIMRRDENGFFYFVARADDMFVCNGENVHPGEVERLLETHPDVRQAAVIAVEDHVRGQIPVAFVVPETPDIDVGAVKSFTLEKGPSYSHPRQIHCLASLPLSPTNKVDRKALAALARAEATTGE